jgi:hypothetical protein
MRVPQSNGCMSTLATAQGPWPPQLLLQLVALMRFPCTGRKPQPMLLHAQHHSTRSQGAATQPLQTITQRRHSPHVCRQPVCLQPRQRCGRQHAKLLGVPQQPPFWASAPPAAAVHSTQPRCCAHTAVAATLLAAAAARGSTPMSIFAALQHL